VRDPGSGGQKPGESKEMLNEGHFTYALGKGARYKIMNNERITVGGLSVV